MAGKDQDFDNLDIDDFEGMDFGEDDIFGDSNGGDERSPTGEIARGVLSGIKNSVLSKDSIKKLVSSTLGKGYAQTLGTYDTLKTAGEEIISSQQKDARQLVRDVGNALPQGGKIEQYTPQWIKDETKRPTDDDGGHEEEDDDADYKNNVRGIDSLLKHSKTAEKQRLIRETRDRGDSLKLSSLGLRASGEMISGINRLVAYQDKVTISYHRKSLEQGYRMIDLMSKSLKLNVTVARTQDEALREIVKNTALPDFVKLKGSEFIKANIRNRIAEATVNKLSKGMAPIVNKVKEGASNLMSGIGMVTDQFQGEDGADPMTMIGQMLSQAAGEWVGDKTKPWLEKAGAKAKPWLNKIPGFSKLNTGLRRFGKNIPLELNELAESYSGDSEMMSMLLNYLGTDSSVVKHERSGLIELEDPALFDMKTHRTINDIIPGLLTSIDRNTYRIATGEDRGDMVWSHHDGKLSDRKTVAKQTIDFGLKEGKIDDARYVVDGLMEELGTHTLSTGARTALRREMMKKMLGNRKFKPTDYVDFNAWKDTDPRIAMEIIRFFKDTFGIGDDGKHQTLDGENKFHDFDEVYSESINKISDYKGRMNELLKVTGTQPWEDAGLAKVGADGEYVFDEGKLADSILSHSANYSFEGKKADIERIKEKQERLKREVAERSSGVFGSIKRKLGFTGKDSSEHTVNPITGNVVSAGLSEDDLARAALEDVSRSEEDNPTGIPELTGFKGMFSKFRKKVSDTSVATRVSEIKEALLTKSFDELTGQVKTTYDENFTKEKADEIRTFLKSTKVGKIIVDKVRKSEEYMAENVAPKIESGGFMGLFGGKGKTTPEDFASSPPTRSGFADGVVPGMGSYEDVGTHTRLDALNETQMASQMILSEMLESLMTLPAVIAGANPAGMEDIVVRNRQSRMQRLGGWMRENLGVRKNVSRGMSMIGGLAKTSWNAAGFFGRGIRGTMGLGVKAGALATKAGINALKGAGGLVSGAAGVAGTALTAGASVAKAGIGMAGSLLTSVIPPMFHGLLGIGKSAGGLMAGLAKAPMKLAKGLLGKLWGKDPYRDFDAYFAGEEEPRMTSATLKDEGYRKKDGTTITALDQIDSAVYGPDNNIVITKKEVDLKSVLYDINGKELHKIGSGMMGSSKLASKLRRIGRPVLAPIKKLMSGVGAILSAPLKLLGLGAARLRKMLKPEDEVGEVHLQIATEQLIVQNKILHLLQSKLNSGDESPDENSWMGITAARNKRKESTLSDVTQKLDELNENLGDKLDNVALSAGSEGGSLMDKVKGFGGKIGGWLKKGGRLLTGAASFLKVGSLVGGAKALAAGTLAAVGGTALAVVGIVAVVAAIGYLAYKGYKTAQAKKMYLFYLRMVQYGINPEEEDQVRQIAQLEALFKQNTTVTYNNALDRHVASVDISKIDNNVVWEILGMDPDSLANDPEYMKEKGPDALKVLDWVVNRFLPVYRSHATACASTLGSLELEDMDGKIKGDKGVLYLEYLSTEMIDSFQKTKYGNQIKAWDDRSFSPFGTRWFRKDVWADSDEVHEAYVRAEQHFQQQSKSREKDMTEKSFGRKRDQDAVKAMKEDTVLNVSYNGTSDVNAINSGIKAGGFFSGIQSENGYVKGDRKSMARNLGALDQGTAIRYMTYGLKEMVMTDVERLWQLETYMIDMMPHGTKFFTEVSDGWDRCKVIYKPTTEEATNDLEFWYRNRFVPVLETYIIALISRNILELNDAWKFLKPAARWSVSSEVVESKVTSRSNKVPYSPWIIDKGPFKGGVNTDPSSVTWFLASLEKEVAKEIVQIEGNKTLLLAKTEGELAEKEKPTLPGSNVTTPSIMNSADIMSGIHGTKPGQPPGFMPGISVMPTEGGIVTSGKAHTPVKGHTTEVGQAAVLAAAQAAGITDKNELAMLLGQVAEESGSFKAVEENLRYKADSMIRVWPNRFAHRPEYARKLAAAGPEAIANEIYGNRMGNTEPGDGWKYRGRGYMQLTGKDNYAQIGKYLGIDLVSNPDLVSSSPDMAAKTAIAFWMTRGGGIRAAAQQGDINTVTRRVNGGLTNLSQRTGYFNHYKSTIDGLLANPAPIMDKSESSAPLVASTPLSGSSGAPAMDAPSATTLARESTATASAVTTAVDASAPPAKQVANTPAPPPLLAASAAAPPVNVNVDPDGTTVSLMDAQLSTQQGMSQALADIRDGIATLNATSQGKTAPPTMPTRSIPSATRSG